MLRKMNNRVCGVMLAAMMAAAVSATACGGQGSTGKTVTAQHPEDFVGMPNPFTDNATLEEAEEYAGFSIQVPDQISGVSATAFRNLGQEMLEVIYYNGEQEVARIRKSLGNKDNSGNYVGYVEIQNKKISDRDVTLKGNDGKVVLAIWSDGTYSYSISLDEQGVSLEEMTALVKSVK